MAEKRHVRKHPTPMGTALIGFVGALVLLAFAYGAFTKRIPFVHGYRLKVEFQSSNQLRGGSPVRIAGVNVGKVVGFEEGPGNARTVIVELKDSARPIHADARARIRSRLFLEGGFYVELSPGSASAPEIEDGGRIPLAQTRLPVQFSQILSALDHPTRDSLRTLIDETATGLDHGGAEAFGRAAKPAIGALRDSARLAEAARGEAPGDVQRLVQGSRRVTVALASRRAQLQQLVGNLATTTGALAAEQQGLRGTVRELDAMLRIAPPALTDLERGLPGLERLARDVRPSLKPLPAVLRDTDKTLVQLDALTRARELPRLLDDLSPALAELPTLERRLTDLFPLVTPVVECVRDQALPVLTAKVPDGSLSVDAPVWQELVHAMVGQASASQSFDANGPSVRLLPGLGEATLSLGDAVGRGPVPVGSRPVWLGNGRHPPFRPDVPCKDNPPVDLSARAGGPGTARRVKAARMPVGPLSREGMRALLDRAPAILKDGGR